MIKAFCYALATFMNSLIITFNMGIYSQFILIPISPRKKKKTMLGKGQLFIPNQFPASQNDTFNVYDPVDHLLLIHCFKFYPVVHTD